MSAKRSSEQSQVDGRHERSRRTRRLIVEAYIDLLRQNAQMPTAPQIAERAGYSVRSVFGRFSGLVELSVAAIDYAMEQSLALPIGDKVHGDRQSRLKFQVTARARICETWLPLWRVLVRNQNEADELKDRIERVRDAIRDRLVLMYGLELNTLSKAERSAMLIALEALTDFESWGRMRERHGLSFEAACTVWIAMIDRILPPTPHTNS